MAVPIELNQGPTEHNHVLYIVLAWFQLFISKFVLLTLWYELGFPVVLIFLLFYSLFSFGFTFNVHLTTHIHYSRVYTHFRFILSSPIVNYSMRTFAHVEPHTQISPIHLQ